MLLSRHPFSRTSEIRARVVGVYAILVVANLVAWTWALLSFYDRPALLGAALLAYSFGLRHAVDADHIAAIDNVIRKLMHDGQRPVGVGFFFALGHSTVVVLAVAVAGFATAMFGSASTFKEVGGLVGTMASAFFLFAVAAANVVILQGVWRAFQQVRRGGVYANEEIDALLNGRGLLARMFRPLFKLVTKSWHMFPLGMLFGIGFETATEVALLGLSSTQAASGGSLWSIMVFPALFAAGMAFVDTTDGIVMLGACDWAFRAPLRKLYYNLIITSLSVLLAVLIGAIEVLGVIGDRLELSGGLWSLIAALNDHFNVVGFVIVGVFILAWVASVGVYRLYGLDEVAGRLTGARRLSPIVAGAAVAENSVHKRSASI